MQHFVHYLQRRVAIVNYANKNDPWFAENQPEHQGFDMPSFHATRASNGPAARVKQGDVIWLFSQLRSPWGALPVSLDAKFVVNEVSDCRSDPDTDVAFRFAAGQGSAWFPLFDCSSCLEELQSIDARSKSRPLVKDTGAHPGLYLRRMRQILDPAPLLALESSIRATDMHFISYRLADGTADAFDLCDRLVTDRKSVWWDRWSLPRRMAERREFMNDADLDAKVFADIANSDTVWGVESASYGEEGSYSLLEQQKAKQLGKYRAHARPAR